jgi:tripartite-type tricarboxylate transporter receptor subunit TctC
MKRFFLVVGLFMTGYSLGIVTVQAQPFPNHPIQLIIPGDPGSAIDISGRAFSEELSRILKVSVIPLNKPGGAATVGTDYVAKSKKNGYTILYANTSAIIYAKASHPEATPYDPLTDLEPLGLHCFFPSTVTVQESSPWKTFMEMVDHVKKNPGKLSIGTSGQGSIDHFNVEIIKSLTGMQFNMVPFKGPAAAVTALLGGHVDACTGAISLVAPHAKAGRVRILIITKKLSQFPDIPTITESGYKQGHLLSAWFALFAPAGIPEEAKNVLVPAIEKTIKNPDLGPYIEKLGFAVEYISPVDLKKLVAEEYAMARSLAIKLGLSK